MAVSSGVSWGQTFSWTNTTTGDWNNSANWSPSGVPNGASSQAQITNAISANAIVNLNLAVTLGDLTIGESDGTHAFWIRPTVANGTLTFLNNVADATLVKNGGATDVIEAATTSLDQKWIITVNAGALNLAGKVTGQTGRLEKEGGSTLNLIGSLNVQNYGGATRGVLVNNGTMNILNPANSIANLVTVQGGTLNIGGNAASRALTAAASSGATQLTLDSVTGLSVGMAIQGPGISSGTIITGIAGNVITLSVPTGSALSVNSERIVFGGPTLGIASSADTTHVTLNSVAGLATGMTVSGTNIAAGTTILAIVGNTVTLSQAYSGSVTANDTLSFGTASRNGLAGAYGGGNGAGFATATANAGGSTITLNSTAGLSLGMLVTGPGVPANTTISAIAGNQITLSNPLSGTGTVVAVNAPFYFGTGQTTFIAGQGALAITGGTTNFGTAGNAANVTIDADLISITGGTLNLQNGNGGGFTDVRAGATNKLKLDGGTVGTAAGTATGYVRFADGMTLELNNNATFNITGISQNYTFASIGHGVSSTGSPIGNDTTIISSTGNSTLTLGGDATNDVFNGALNMSGSTNSRIIKIGNEILTLGGARDNAAGRVEVRSGTVVLAKASSPTVHALGGTSTVGDGVGGVGADVLQIGGTNVGLGGVMMGANYRDQIHRGVTINLTASGVLDLAGFSEGFNQLNGVVGGEVRNSAGATTQSTLFLGENNPAAFTFSGNIGGTGALATRNINFWKGSSSNITFDQLNTYTGQTLIGRASLVLQGANGAISGTSDLFVTTGGQFAILDNSALHASNNRVNDSATVVLDKGGLVLLRRNNNVLNLSTETFGNLTVQNGFSQVRIDHSDGANTTSNVLGNQATLTFSGYTHNQGGVVAFTEVANVSGTAAFSTTNAATAKSRVQFLDFATNSWLIGDEVKVLIGAYGGTHNGAVDRLVTLDSSGYVRLLDTGSSTDFRTRFTANGTFTAPNVTASNLGTATRDDNAANTIGTFIMKIDPTGSSPTNELKGEVSYNAWVQSGSGSVTISEQNILHLGGRAADATFGYLATDGTGMLLVNNGGSVVFNGGTVNFGAREANIRANNTTTFRSKITGSNGLVKSGGAVLIMQGWNTYSGLTTLTQGEIQIFTDKALGLSGAGNGVRASNASITLTSGVNIGEFGQPSGSTNVTKDLTMDIGANLLQATDQANVWNGKIMMNNVFAYGQNANNITFRANNDSVLVLNGAITGISSAFGGFNMDPAYNAQGEGRGLIFENGGSTANRGGIIRVNGSLTDEDFVGAVANHQRLNVFMRGYTGQSSATNSKFNVFLKDASQTNGVLDVRSGYLHLENGYASGGGPGGAGTNFVVTAEALAGDLTLTVDSVVGLTVGTVITGAGLDVGTTIAAINGNVIVLSVPLVGDVPANSVYSSGAGGTFTIIRNHDGGNVDRAGTISAILLSKAGAVFRSPNIQLAENVGSYSSNSTHIMGGEHTSGTAIFGSGANTVDLNPITGTSGFSVSIGGTAINSGVNSLAISSTSNLRVGYGVAGTGIPAGAKIGSISGNTITIVDANGNPINTSAGIPANTSLTFGYLSSTTNKITTAAAPVLTLNKTPTFGFGTGEGQIPMNSVSGLVVGMTVTGQGIAPNTTISSIDYNSGVISLSTTTTGNDNGTITFGIATNSSVIMVNNISGLTAGSGISGTGIQGDTRIASIDQVSPGLYALTLTRNTNAAPGASPTYEFYQPTNTIQLSDVTGLQVGMGIAGTGIRAGTIITGIDPVTRTITMSAPTNGLAPASQAYTFPLPVVSYNVGLNAPSGTSVLNLSSVAGLVVGTTVSGTGIQNGTVILAIDTATNTITLSLPTNAALTSNSSSINIQKNSNYAEARLYQQEGGTTDFQLRFTEDGGFGLQNEVAGLTKVGRGTTIVSGSTTGAGDLDGGVNVHGGALVFSYGSVNGNNSRVNGAGAGAISASPYQLTMAGGELRLENLGTAGNVVESLRGVLTLRPGGSSITGKAALSATITLHLGLDNPFTPFITTPIVNGSIQKVVANPNWYWRDPDRYAGATLNFVIDPSQQGTTRYYYSQNALDGDGINGGGGLGYFTALPYMTIKTAAPGDTAYVDFASFISEPTGTQSNTLIGDSSGVMGSNLYNLNNENGAANVSNWDLYARGLMDGDNPGDIGVINTGYFTDDLLGGTSAKYSGTLQANYGNDFYGAKLIRYAANLADSTITIASGTRLVVGAQTDYHSFTAAAGDATKAGGAILISNSVGAHNQFLLGGQITSALLSNYAAPAPKVANTGAAATAGANSVTLTSTSGLTVGMTVVGVGVAPGTTITGISGNVITLSTGLTYSLSGNQKLEFNSMWMPGALTRPNDTTALITNPSPDASQYVSRDLVIHNYNESGVFTVGSQVVDYTGAPSGPSKLNLVVSGPGVTHLTNAANSYTGSTFVNGGGVNDVTGQPIIGTLWIANQNRLGTVPATTNPSSIYLNGGRLRFAADTNPSTTNLGNLTLDARRGITLGGNGGYIELVGSTPDSGTTLQYDGIIRSEDNYQSGNTAANQLLANPGVGDLIKEGNGRLILTNSKTISPLIGPISSSFTLWNAYYGLTEVRGGVLELRINQADSGILGSNDTTIDGTVVRSGARLDFEITGGAGNGTKEWINLNGGTLGTTANHVDGTLDGVINVTANSTIDVAGGSALPNGAVRTLRLNTSAGYLSGTGRITKTGAGRLVLFENNSEFTGGWEIRGGSVIGRSQGLPVGQTGNILLGDTSSNPAVGTAGLYLASRIMGSNFTSEYNVKNDIVVRAPAAGSQIKEIGAQNSVTDLGPTLSLGSVSYSNGGNTINVGVANAGSFHPGMVVTGANIHPGTVVTAVNFDTGVVTVSRNFYGAGTSITGTSFGTSLTGTTVSGSNIVNVPGGVSNLFTGMQVSGPGIAAGTVITAINAVTNQVTLSSNASTTTGVAFATLANQGASTTSGNATITITGANAAAVMATLFPGMQVSGTNIPAGATIVSVNHSANQITLNTNASATGAIVNFGAQKNFNTISGSNVVTVTGNVTGLTVGQVLNGITGIPNGATIQSIDPITNKITISQNATVTNVSVAGASYTTGQNNDIYRYSGSITLNDGLQLAYRDVGVNAGLVNSSTVNTTATLSGGNTIVVANASGLTVGMEVIGAGIPAGATITAISGTTITLNVPTMGTGSGFFLTASNNIWGAQQGGPVRRIVVDGQLSGSGGLTTVVDLAGTVGNLVRTYFEINHANNSGWTGSLVTGNASDIQTQQHVVRFGSSGAISSSNSVTMKYNTSLEVGGNNLTIGNLTIDAGVVATGNGAAIKGIIIENASNNAGSIRIVQNANSNWDALFQNGITPAIYSAASTSTHDNSLSIIKAGTGVATLTQNNTYTGTTTIENGTLRSGANNVIPDASAVTVNATGAGVTAVLDLNGFNDTIASLTLGGSTTTSTANVQTGAGTLTVLGNVTYSAANNAQTSTVTGNVALTSASTTFTVGDSTTAATDLMVTAALSGSVGIVKDGAGLMALGGNNTYTGNTTVNAGNLQVGVGGVGRTSALGGTGVTTVAATATISGTGTVSGTAGVTNHVVNGTIRPGDSGGSGNGTLTFSGNLNTAAATSQFALQLGSTNYVYSNASALETPGSGAYTAAIAQITTDMSTQAAVGYDKVDVKGTLTLGTDTRFTVTYAAGTTDFAVGSVFNLLDWTTILTGGNSNGALGNGTRGAGLLGDMDLPTLGAGKFWDVSQFYTHGIIFVAGAVPEPSRVVLLLIAFGAAVMRRRRRSAC
ncbi:autotransporter-associated beta strand repeat-containing protein [Verrucomicrobium sp. BvORR034]|uniref:autotransporter-associated beta strand repeat-containing protein n=1 Tax=Verrucomicrobium sp. BvORR034 TaxID=1396418 RepID=UPI002240EE9C|nr:autotransporter-associated beta strand repeat-containing protein [Verrucomicrobium sp. BvORR034]